MHMLLISIAYLSFFKIEQKSPTKQYAQHYTELLLLFFIIIN